MEVIVIEPPMQPTAVTIMVPADATYDEILDLWVETAREFSLSATRVSIIISPLDLQIGQWACGMVEMAGIDYVLYTPLDDFAADTSELRAIYARRAVLDDYDARDPMFRLVAKSTTVGLTINSPLSRGEAKVLRRLCLSYLDQIMVGMDGFYRPKFTIQMSEIDTRVELVVDESLLSAETLLLRLVNLATTALQFRGRPLAMYVPFAFWRWSKTRTWPPRVISISRADPPAG